MLFAASFSAQAQQIRAMKIDQLVSYTSSKDTLYVINFWATWCAPCVAELPVFNQLKAMYADKPVKVLLVSLDFKEDIPVKVPTFLQRKRMTPEVVWLAETDPNKFIPKVDNSWQGSIPATLIVQPGKGFKRFIEGQVSERQVKRIVDGVLAHENDDEKDDD